VADARRPAPRACIFVVAVAFVVGCRTAPPSPQLVAWDEPGAPAIVVDDEERALWEEARRGLADLEKTQLLVADPKLAAYLASVLARLLPVALPAAAPVAEVRVLRSVDRQAGALANGTILITTSNLAALEDEAQLAGVLGHEVAHVLGRDMVRRTRYAAVTHSTVERMRLARSLEEAADRHGLVLMRRAGYDPRQMIGALALIEADDAASRSAIPQWESHPYVADRMATLRREIGPISESEVVRGRERYEAAIADVLLLAADDELDARRFDRARLAIDRYLRLHPDSGRGHLLLAEWARLTERDGRRSALARQNYERAVELAPEDPATVRALAVLYREDGDHVRARVLFAKYLRLARDAPDRRLVQRYLDGDGSVQSGEGAR
jgi:predicted Zn-dependent protease